jgi:ABC-2 type transport system permease protein
MTWHGGARRMDYASAVSALRIVFAAFVLQLSITRRSPEHLLILATTPFFSTIFLSLAVYNGRPDVVINAVLAPGLIGLWGISLDLAGSLIGQDRWSGRFELLIASRCPLSLVIFGRILVIVLSGALTFGESWLVARLGFGLRVPIVNPGVFVVAIVLTCFAMAGTATMLAAAFVFSRGLHVFQNALTYPFYILGGILVPVAFLPGWLSPLSRVVFLSWSADLLRDAMRGTLAANWPLRAGIVFLLGALALAVGVVLVGRMVDRARRVGTVGEA